MHLNSKSLFILISPFILAGGVWFFNDVLVTYIVHFFESAQKQKTSILDEKGSTYQFITEHQVEYAALLHKIQIRDENHFWISERFYNPASFTPSSTLIAVPSSLPPPSLSLLPPPSLLPVHDENSTVLTETWSVQMVMPEQKMAIINNRIMRIGQRIDGIKLLQVTDNSVFIQTTKGSQWVKLFH